MKSPHVRQFTKKFYSQERIRNIGIVAHIDAGKTSITEQILFATNSIARVGSVDRGDTVTDYLQEERERGITIQSAAITVPWKDYMINVIDTPGHVDFGFEVERSLRVLDGVIVLLDASKGVQAQTKAVWKQAMSRSLPAVVFVNKMDKVGADLDQCVLDIHDMVSELEMTPLLLQCHLNNLCILNLITQSPVTLDFSLLKEDHEKCRVEYQRLIETLADLDPTFFEIFATSDNVTSEEIITSIQRLTSRRRIIPILCGSAIQSCGVTDLLDAIVNYLPSPLSCSSSKQLVSIQRASDAAINHSTSTVDAMDTKANSNEASVALAFKVIFDSKMNGMLVFVRIYSGLINANTVLVNTTASSLQAEKIVERPTRILKVMGDSYQQCESISAGEIALLVGLKKTRTGDTLVAQQDVKKLSSQGLFVLDGIKSQKSSSVVFCSVEPWSSVDEDRLNAALDIVVQEDPSLTITIDRESSNQQQLGGVGELHLEIAQKRLINEFKCRATFGSIQIAYKEIPIGVASSSDSSSSTGFASDDPNGNTKAEIRNEKVSCWMTKVEISQTVDQKLYQVVMTCRINQCLDLHDDVIVHCQSEEWRDVLVPAMSLALRCGPKEAYPITCIGISVDSVNCHPIVMSSSTKEVLAMAVAQEFVQRHLLTSLAEPIMQVEIQMPSAFLGTIISDIHSRRRGQVMETIEDGCASDQRDTIIRAQVPLATLLGYAGHLRTVTAGHGSLSIKPYAYDFV